MTICDGCKHNKAKGCAAGCSKVAVYYGGYCPLRLPKRSALPKNPTKWTGGQP